MSEPTPEAKLVADTAEGVIQNLGARLDIACNLAEAGLDTGDRLIESLQMVIDKLDDAGNLPEHLASIRSNHESFRSMLTLVRHPDVTPEQLQKVLGATEKMLGIDGSHRTAGTQ